MITDLGSAPNPPEWIAPPPPPPPWATAYDQPVPPPPPPRRGNPLASLGVAAAVVIAALGGLVVGRSVHLHGARPTLSTTAQTPAPPATVPASPFDPSSPPSVPAPATGGNVVPATGGAAAKVNPAVVDINTVLGYQGGAAAGTGMLVTSTGEVLTNNHVIDGATNITVTLVSTGRTYPATVVGTDPTEDVAVLQLNGVSGLATIQTASATVGDAVLAIGNAGGTGGTPAVVSGTVQALDQTITASDNNGANAETLTRLIQTDAPLQPGDSGGPLVNASGQVVGMNTAASTGRRFSAGSTVGFAIPIDKALGIAKQIESGHATSTIHIGLPGFLGVAISPTSSGAVVTGVQSGTPAAAAGIGRGDTITTVDGRTIDSSPTLSTVMRSHRPGDRVTVGWTDFAGAAHSATVTLATGPAD